MLHNRHAADNPQCWTDRLVLRAATGAVAPAPPVALRASYSMSRVLPEACRSRHLAWWKKDFPLSPPERVRRALDTRCVARWFARLRKAIPPAQVCAPVQRTARLRRESCKQCRRTHAQSPEAAATAKTFHKTKRRHAPRLAPRSIVSTHS